jgi:hypothetical protein
MFASFALWGNTNPGEYDWTVSSSDYSKDQDAITDALATADALAGAAVMGSRTTKSFIHSMFYIYEHENNDLVANIATAANLQTFCEIESKLTLLDGYTSVSSGPGVTIGRGGAKRLAHLTTIKLQLTPANPPDSSSLQSFAP